MLKTTIKPVTERQFLKYWKKNRSNLSACEESMYEYFKPYIDKLPVTAFGNYYWQIFSVNDPEILYVGGNAKLLTGYAEYELMAMDPSQFFSLFHPDDCMHAFAFIQKFSTALLNKQLAERHTLNGVIYFRIIRKDGNPIWVSLQHPSYYYSINGQPLFGLAVYTDVTHITNYNMRPMMTLMDTKTKTMQLITCHSAKGETINTRYFPKMTNREKEIFAQLIKGKASKEIASHLGITRSTVDNHRQNLLKKYSAASSIELISKVTGV